MGIGMVLITNENDVVSVCSELMANGKVAYIIGNVNPFNVNSVNIINYF